MRQGRVAPKADCCGPDLCSEDIKLISVKLSVLISQGLSCFPPSIDSVRAAATKRPLLFIAFYKLTESDKVNEFALIITS